jgi:ribosomal protein S18 acetylase RimI-like enzyme
MHLIIPSIDHIRHLMTWFSDKPSVQIWCGPVFRHPFTEETFVEDMRWGDIATFALVDDGGTMIAFGQLYIKQGRAHLARLAVSPARRGQGLASILIDKLIEKARELYQATENSLYVMRTNERALRCYLKAGFVEAPVPEGEKTYPDQMFMVRKAL